ncbi:threonine-phosphate decarboxylase CobD [Cognaticolwellia mytili]|uniref:threonine-phosphate decarboxylase CobD n=1 Tax=Cognaticolwellia mytili TaxID=1888913 RepID=UPI000A16E102|nr:threonine-phosphate decarboxylase CobD [Cognaticolwellia mytili]
MALIHGGQLQQVAEQYKIPLSDWLDVSTGIAPLSYPIPDIPLKAWQQLPQQSPALIAVAKQYYQCSELLVTNGSQAIIKALPELYSQKNMASQDVYLPERGYKEHAKAWRSAGYTLHFYQELLPNINQLPTNCVVVIINPNNPTGKFFDREVIVQYHERLKQLNGLLILDEAFIDVMPDGQSYCGKVEDNHVIVLRSFGKFFGLAGIRIGFLVANGYWCERFKALLGPWQVNGPAQIIAEKALNDNAWHNEQCEKLHTLRVQQEALLWQVFTDKLVSTIQGCDLFLTLSFYQTGNAKKLYHLLCQQGVYCRLSDEQDTLRFGIAVEENLMRLEDACLQACGEVA